MALNDTDLFLVNRDEGTPGSPNWKSYKLTFEKLRDQLAYVPIVLNAGLVNKRDDINSPTAFTTENGSGGHTKQYKNIKKFVFDQSIATGKVEKDQSVIIYNQSKKETIEYTATKKGTFEGSYSVLEVDIDDTGNTGSFDPLDIIQIKVLEDGGNSIEVGDTPPTVTPDDEGTLWYNTTNGITYIWYLNPGTTNGQWVDVRPPID